MKIRLPYPFPLKAVLGVKLVGYNERGQEKVFYEENLCNEAITSEASRLPFIPASKKIFIVSI